MKNLWVKIFSAILCLTVFLSSASLPVSADAASDLRNEIADIQKEIEDNQKLINSLKNDKSNQQALLAKHEYQLSLLQSQINLCNQKIRESNAKIAENDAQIVTMQQDMQETVVEFKKRIRAIYMSGGTGSGLEILMGAEDFSDYVALSQLTQNVTRRDRKMIKDIMATIEKINEQKKENESLIKEQESIKATLDSKYAEYDRQASLTQQQIDKINRDQSSLNNDNKKLQDDLKAKQEELDSILNPNSWNDGVFDGTFKWPVPNYYGITSGYGSRWGSLHKGIDISSGGIRGKAIVASASGTVTYVYNSCPHNYGKQSSCYQGGVRCGGGYGNYVVISHGRAGNTYYQTVYGHMEKATVSVGQVVKKGQTIGYVGSTGWSTGWHLHFEVQTASRAQGPYTAQNPENYVRASK